ncbi:MAG: redox-regulated ATPase YchF [Nanoarchaeota archaeon]
MLVGLVGKPNVGKSTFFKAATLMDVLIANYPFATIKPNHAMAYVKIRDLAADFGRVSKPREGHVKGTFRFVPFELMDVAGLVAGASEGKGLGNQFLDDLAAADAFIHVVDMSGETDAEGKPATNYDPIHDIAIIERELDLWYLGILKKAWAVFARKTEMEHTELAKSVAKQFSGLKVTVDQVERVLRETKLPFEKPSHWTEDQLFLFAGALRKVTKPMVIAANKVDRPRGMENVARIRARFSYPIVPCFSDGELSLRQADKAGLVEYIPGENSFSLKGAVSDKQQLALDSIQKVMSEFGGTGVQQILNLTVFDVLGYVAIYPASLKLEDSKGNVLPDCFLMPPGSTALDFAYRLHTDIGNGFVKALDLKTKKAVGKDHVLKNGDGLEILTK